MAEAAEPYPPNSKLGQYFGRAGKITNLMITRICCKAIIVQCHLPCASKSLVELMSVPPSFDRFSDLPEDIGQTVFELAAENGDGPRCALVTKRVQSW